MKPKISVIYPTCRPGSIDLLAWSLSQQPKELYELIVVDGYPGRVNEANASYFLCQHNINLIWYGPPKSKNYDLPLSFANSMNTGLLHARADRVVFLHDYSFLQPGSLENWIKSFEENGTKAIISGIARKFDAPQPDKLDDISVWNSDLHTTLGKLTIRDEWIPEIWEIFHCGFHIDFFNTINGFDERADGFIAWPLESVMTQAPKHGYRFVVDRRLWVGSIEHHHWKDSPVWNLGVVGVTKQEDFLCRENEPGWLRVSPNPYNFAEERKRNIG